MTPWSINNAKIINIALLIFKIPKTVTPTTFPMKFDTSKPDINGVVKRKNGRVHQIFVIDILKFFMTF